MKEHSVSMLSPYEELRDRNTLVVGKKQLADLEQLLGSASDGNHHAAIIRNSAETIRLHSRAVLSAMENGTEDWASLVQQFAEAAAEAKLRSTVGGEVIEALHITNGGTIEYIRQLSRLGITGLEVSNISGRLSNQTQMELAKMGKDELGHTIGVVGQGTTDDIDVGGLNFDIGTFLDANVDRIALHGGPETNAGIYDANHKPRTLAAIHAFQKMDHDIDKLIIEAAHPKQASYWLTVVFGHRLRLGSQLLGHSNTILDATHARAFSLGRPPNTLAGSEALAKLEAACNTAEEGSALLNHPGFHGVQICRPDIEENIALACEMIRSGIHPSELKIDRNEEPDPSLED